MTNRKPLTEVSRNGLDSVSLPMIRPTGFREYDVRWRYPEEINLLGIQALGLGLATQLHEAGLPPVVVVGQDYRSYSLAIKQALTIGLMEGGAEVRDIGLALSPMAYFAQFDLDAQAVAMVTASHNPNGWTGVKMGMQRPLTFAPEDMTALRDLVFEARFAMPGGGRYIFVPDMTERYIADLLDRPKLKRPLKVVVSCGNGTAAAFAPQVLESLGCEIIPLNCELDYTFPVHNPNPEDMGMLDATRDCILASGADLGLLFDGDGDRCGVVDNEGEAIFADKVGVMLARHLSSQHKGATFVADVKSTGLFLTDPVLKANGAKTLFWKTGHSYIKRYCHETGALAGFEKSGHYILAAPIGRGYDCGPRIAVEICKLLDRNPERGLSDLHRALPRTYATPTMSPWCADEEKYAVIERLVARLVAMAAGGERLGPLRVEDVITVNGARVMLEGGAWALVRASSNTPNLVVVCESPASEAELRAIFAGLDAVIRTEPAVGDYDQTF